MKGFNRIHVSAIVCVLLVAVSSLRSLPALAAGRNMNPGVMPPQSAAFGKSYAEWGAAWWQWELNAPIDNNPILDTTGEFANFAQQGPVFFLAGSFGEEVVRYVTMPTGKALFFPVANWILTYPEDVPVDVNASDVEALSKFPMIPNVYEENAGFPAVLFCQFFKGRCPEHTDDASLHAEIDNCGDPWSRNLGRRLFVCRLPPNGSR